MQSFRRILLFVFVFLLSLSPINSFSSTFFEPSLDGFWFSDIGNGDNNDFTSNDFESTPNEEYVPAIWVGGTDGVKKYSTSDGSQELKIDTGRSVSDVAVDGRRGVLWTLWQDRLTSYNFLGEQLLGVTISEIDKGSNSLLEVNIETGTVWIASNKSLIQVDQNGAVISHIMSEYKIEDFSIDSTKNNVWFVTKKSVIAYNEWGGVATEILIKDKGVSLVYSSYHEQVWVVSKKGLSRYNAAGQLIYDDNSFENIQFIDVDYKGGVWISSKKEISYVDSLGNVSLLSDATHDNGEGTIIDIVSDPSNHCLWVIYQNSLIQVQTSGFKRIIDDEIEQKNGGNIAIALYADDVSPTITIDIPKHNEYLNANKPIFEVLYEDAESGVDTSSLMFLLDGA